MRFKNGPDRRNVLAQFEIDQLVAIRSAGGAGAVGMSARQACAVSLLAIAPSCH